MFSASKLIWIYARMYSCDMCILNLFFSFFRENISFKYQLYPALSYFVGHRQHLSAVNFGKLNETAFFAFYCNFLCEISKTGQQIKCNSAFINPSVQLILLKLCKFVVCTIPRSRIFGGQWLCDYTIRGNELMIYCLTLYGIITEPLSAYFSVL